MKLNAVKFGWGGYIADPAPKRVKIGPDWRMQLSIKERQNAHLPPIITYYYYPYLNPLSSTRDMYSSQKDEFNSSDAMEALRYIDDTRNMPTEDKYAFARALASTLIARLRQAKL